MATDGVRFPGLDVCEISNRELEVLLQLGKGKSNKEIARQLHISEWTVKIHVQKVLKKLGVENRTEAACLVVRLEQLIPNFGSLTSKF